MKTLQGRVIPETVGEALEAWDAGAEVQTVRMAEGGSYAAELVIQTAMFEILRALEADAELAIHARWLLGEAPDELTKGIEMVLVTADALTRERYSHALNPIEGGLAASLAIQIFRLGFQTVQEVARTRLIFIANPAAIQPNRAERRAAEAEARKLN